MKALHDIKPVCELEGCDEDHNQTLSDAIEQMGAAFAEIDGHIEDLIAPAE